MKWINERPDYTADRPFPYEFPQVTWEIFRRAKGGSDEVKDYSNCRPIDRVGYRDDPDDLAEEVEWASEWHYMGQSDDYHDSFIGFSCLPQMGHDSMMEALLWD